ncbi:MAG TPA: gliding motility-associated C-terminal domain-containing protein [Saprospiraceae bacterium]|nr:gliding motility-associated C-terminal domain-containing protein [Saprospiraceae bacterium]
MKKALLPLRRIFVFVALSGFLTQGFTQNLVPNPSFETYSWCPGGFGTGGTLSCTPWVNGNDATADFLHECASPTNVGIPVNFFGNQPAHTGDAYAGVYARESSIWREYIQVQLTQPLTSGLTYHVSFYTSLSDNNCGVTHLGAYLSQTPPDDNTIGWLAATPQIEANIGYISNNQDWTLISGCFTATGGEQWITIGNFYDNNNSPLDPDCVAGFYSYYYIDDVSVTEGDPAEELELELGPSVSTCDPYEIESGITGVDYHWSDGSNDPTLIVTESGVYALTVTSGCSQEIDSVEVTFMGVAVGVNMGPAEITICDGDIYSISLDPDAGEYVWQDGSTGPEYNITIPGLYQITLDDGCDITSDQMSVIVLNEPSPFSLGDDTFLCDGDEIVFSFDPGLGNFLWQDNSTASEYTVLTGGNYALTISNQCGSFSDAIAVTSATLPSIELGADQIICEGETYVIELDSELGDFLWQDGTTSSTYMISDQGTYSVTLTNDCGSASDEIFVSLNSTPPVFSLGENTFLCDGNEINFSFDPALGDFLWQDNTTSSEYTISSGGAYSLTITNECGQVSDNIEVIAQAIPVLDLGPQQQMLCVGQQIIFDLDPGLGEFLWQDGSETSSYSISTPGFYSVTVTNECGSADDNLEAVLIGEPLFDLGENIVVCPAQLPITLNVSDVPFANSYQWQDNSTGPQFQVSSPGIFSVTVSNECFSISDVVEVIVENASPVVQLPSDQTLCEGETFELNSGGLLGNYLWQDGSTTSNFLVTAAGMYSLTITNQCGFGSDSIHITYWDSLDTPDLGPDIQLCPGGQYTFYAEGTNVNYLWQDLSTADSLIVSQAGIYVLQMSNSCNAVSDTVVVTGNSNPPSINLPDSMHLCASDTISIDAGISGVQFLWSMGSQSSSIDVAEPGIYSVTVTNSCGSDADTIIIVDAGPLPYVSLNADTSLCTGETIVLSPVASNVTSWLWNDGSTGSTLAINSSGLVTVQVSNNCGVSVDSLIVTELSVITGFDLGTDTTLCSGEALLISVDLPDVNVEWPNGSTGHSYEVTNSGQVIATISNQCGSYSDSINVNFLPAIPELDLGIDQSLCPGEVIAFSPGLTGIDYLWQDGSTDPIYNATMPGLVILSISNECGVNIDSVEIIEDTDGPEVNLGADVLACEGEVVTLVSDILGVDFLWQDGSTLPQYSPAGSGMYILQVSNACGVDADTVVVEFNGTQPSPSLGNDTVLCDGVILQLHSNASGETSVEWQDGSTLPVLNIDSAGTYILTESNNCGNVSDTIVIMYTSLPVAFDLGSDTILCPEEFVVLTAPATTDLITWQDGSHVEFMIADQAQLYSLEVSNRCGSVRDEINILIDDKIPVLALGDEISLCQFSSISLDATQSFEASYNWSTGNTGPSIVIDHPGLYSVDVSTKCFTVTHEIEVIPQKDCDERIYIPNIISPNGDGVNDVFNVFFNENLDITALTCSIFDRWGNHVFNSTDINFKWYGQFSGVDVLPGVYVYSIDVETTINGERQNRIFKGDITVVK